MDILNEIYTRHGFEARGYEAEAKPKLWSNHEAEAVAVAEALTFWKHQAEAEALARDHNEQLSGACLCCVVNVLPICDCMNITLSETLISLLYYDPFYLM